MTCSVKSAQAWHNIALAQYKEGLYKDAFEAMREAFNHTDNAMWHMINKFAEVKAEKQKVEADRPELPHQG